MFGLSNSTSRFMVVLGRVAGFVNLFLLFAASVVFFYLGLMSVTGGEYPWFIRDNQERKQLVQTAGGWLLPLSIIMMYTVYLISQMILANRQLSGVMGLAAFLKTIIL